MEKLITISEDSQTSKSIIPKNNGKLQYIKYKVLIENPYKYTEFEFFREVHHVIRKKTSLKIEKYLIHRMHLLKKFGWGVHVNNENKIAIIPCESEKYRNLLDDPTVRKSKAYKNNKCL